MPPHSNSSIKPSTTRGLVTRGGIDAVKAGAEATRKELEAVIRVEKKAADDARAMVEDMKKQLEALVAQLEAAQAEIRAMRLEATRANRDVQPEVPMGDESTDQPSGTASELVYLCGSIFDIGSTADIGRLWPNGQVLTYRFIDGHPNQHAKVAEVISKWSHFANITFKLLDEETTPPSAVIVISFKSEWGCWGFVGTNALTAAGSPFTMALGGVSESPNITQRDRAFILHQFGHALGLVHEHLSPSETDAVALKEGLISKFYSSRNPDASVGKYIDTCINASVTNYAAPDLSSVMVYAIPGEFNEGNFTVEPNATFSPLDKAFMVINYPRPQTHDEEPEWTLRHALVIAGVDEDTSRLIIEEQDVTKRRFYFARYISSARQRNSAALVDPAPQSVLDLMLPAVQDALRGLFESIDTHPETQDIRGDYELAQKLDVVLDRLAGHQIVREVVQRALPPPSSSDLDSSKSLEIDEDFINRLLEIVVTIYDAANPRVSALTTSQDDVKTRQVDAVTALCNELVRYPMFQNAMEQAIGKDVSPASEYTTPMLSSKLRLAAANLGDDAEALDVSGIVAQLSTRPAILGAVRRALVG
ncbi:hypothetical protein BDZ94DRAFT_793381 [Collybia nuda]|uniref:Peptidase metallopeptidase domain-containing protein n=1 Tax=Collybia nuda TaxID=64659 RepID=A0A9P5Y312_9AGAR|nr:hypothetical protein BDZ94DRAFT_793381 [Collybia nuda]